MPPPPPSAIMQYRGRLCWEDSACSRRRHFCVSANLLVLCQSTTRGVVDCSPVLLSYCHYSGICLVQMVGLRGRHSASLCGSQSVKAYMYLRSRGCSPQSNIHWTREMRRCLLWIAESVIVHHDNTLIQSEQDRAQEAQCA